MNFRKKISSSNSGFQIAPLIDIIFLILIWFISASLYSQWETKLNVKTPTSTSGVHAKRYPGEAVINLNKKEEIYINSMKVSKDRLFKLLNKLSDVYPDQPVIIRADKNTSYQKLIDVLDTCKKANINIISFATTPEKQ